MYKTHNPHGIEVIFNAHVKNYSNQENRLHTYFRHRKVSGEWYRLNDEDISYIKEYLFPFMTSVIEKYG